MKLSQTVVEVIEVGLELFQRSDEDLTADLNRYTKKEALLTRALAMVSSSISIISGLVSFYYFMAIDRKRRVFRHQLIIFLILYDFIKAAFLLMYPARVIAKSTAYYDVGFCKVVGFFTAMSMEGSDLAILSFAIHAALLIYRPESKIKNGAGFDGGLYRYRYLVYLASILIPVLLASLAFINGIGYMPLTSWCYIPTDPIWYRLGLSWIPRYIIIVTIFIIYGCIYQHVKKQYVKIDKTRRKLLSTKKHQYLKSLYELAGFILFQRVHVSNQDSDSYSEGDDTRVESGQTSDWNRLGCIEEVQGELNKESFDEFRSRKLRVERQMKALFIYPVSYVLLWIFPLTVHALQFKDGLTRQPVVWLNCVAAFMQPFNGTVDSFVFLIREKPWKITTYHVDSQEVLTRDYSGWRRRISFLPLFSLPNSNKIEAAAGAASPATTQFKHLEMHSTMPTDDLGENKPSNNLETSLSNVSDDSEGISLTKFLNSFSPSDMKGASVAVPDALRNDQDSLS